MAVLLGLSGGLFAAAWSSRQGAVLVAAGRAGPISTNGRLVRQPVRSIPSSGLATDLRLGLRFVAARGGTSGTVFALGPAATGVEVVLRATASGAERAFLLGHLVDGSPIDELLGTLQPGRVARLQLTVRQGKELVVLLDGHRTRIEYPFIEIAPVLSPLSVGGGARGQASFAGRVEGFSLGFWQRTVPAQTAGYRALEAGAGVAFVLAVLVGLMGLGGLLDRRERVAPAGVRRAEDGGGEVEGATGSRGAGTSAGSPGVEAAPVGLRASELDVASRWLVVVAVFALALCMWWVAYEYFRNPAATYGLGFWNPSDRAAWLPVTAPYYPLVGQHFFGDFFQFFYLIRHHDVYTGRRFHTDLNPGYLLPSALVAWLPYPAAGFCYVSVLLAAWLLPGVVIGRARPLLGVCYLLGATLTVPGLMALDLGQPQVFLYVLAIGALALFSSAPRTSAVLMGLAIAIKPYMVLFLLLYLFRRRAKGALLALGVALGVNLVLGLALGGAHFLSAQVLGQIVGGMTSYGSGASLKIWGGQPFLHDNSSLFALFETLHQAGAPVLGTVGRALVDHYTVVQVLVGLFLAWLLVARRATMAIEDQWLLVTAAVLLIPSYSLGYAWLLLLGPLAVRTWRVALDPGLASGPSGAREYLPLLAIVAYPTVVTGAAFANPAFGPNGNSIVTPLLVSALVVGIAWSARAGGAQANVAVAHGGPLGMLRVLGRSRTLPDRGLLYALVAGVALELTVAAVTFGLSGGAPHP